MQYGIYGISLLYGEKKNSLNIYENIESDKEYIFEGWHRKSVGTDSMSNRKEIFIEKTSENFLYFYYVFPEFFFSISLFFYLIDYYVSRSTNEIISDMHLGIY